MTMAPMNFGKRHYNREAELLERIDRLERAIKQVPSRFRRGGGASDILELDIIDGQTVEATTPIYGIKRFSGTLTTVPSAYDPNGVGATPGLFTATDGIGRARLYTNGVSGTLVLVLHDSTSHHSNPLATFDFPTVYGTKKILVGAGPSTVTVYQVGFP